MFERYTEKARRVIFFARYEAIQFGSPCIETEHLLLGLLREDGSLFRQLIPTLTHEGIRSEVASHTVIEPGESTSAMSVDLPLSNESKRVLAYAVEEAEHLNDRHIGTEHLLLGLLREPESPGGLLLLKHGADLKEFRTRVEQGLKGRSEAWSGHHAAFHPAPRSYRSPAGSDTVQIHGSHYNVGYIHERVMACREFLWHWNKRAWTARDLMIDRKSGAMSFDLGLAEQSPEFEVLKGGWRKDSCYVCHWELFESTTEPEHGIAYTNGHDWLCSECFEKFMGDPTTSSSNFFT